MVANSSSLSALHQEIVQCTLCQDKLPHEPRPIFQGSPEASIVLIGQAPGRKVHESGIPWNDASGNKLREWLGIEKEIFYNPKKVLLLPMGMCFPGTGKSGDLPPQPICAPTWHPQIFEAIDKANGNHAKKTQPRKRLTVLIGSYAQKYYLEKKRESTLTETVRQFKHYLPEFFPLVHPSPRNGIWLKKNPWFEKDVLPVLKKRVKQLL